MIRDEHHPDQDLATEGFWCQDNLGFGVAEVNRGSRKRYAVYTLGLIVLDHPEFIVFGLPPDAARLVLFSLGRKVVNEGKYFHACIDAWAVEDVNSARVLDVPPQVRLVGFSLEEERRLFPDGLDRTGWEDGPPAPMLRVAFESAAELKPMRFARSALVNDLYLPDGHDVVETGRLNRGDT